MNDLFFSLEKLLDYKGNRYELARACMEYAKRVRYIAPDAYRQIGEKEALVALKHLLDNDIKYTSDPFEIEIYEDEASIVASQQEAQQMKKLKREESLSEEKARREENSSEEKPKKEVKAEKKEEETLKEVAKEAPKAEEKAEVAQETAPKAEAVTKAEVAPKEEVVPKEVKVEASQPKSEASAEAPQDTPEKESDSTPE